ncbi:hypothetical protein [Micromonospora sp. NPDC049662]|uniref:hypothetical protein n=1 Tax=Micromonospora sp. NPDC049662 TaxID=3155397 RepID=UPI003419F424
MDELLTVQIIKPEWVGRPTIHLAAWNPGDVPSAGAEPRELITLTIERAGLLVNTVADALERIGGGN